MRQRRAREIAFETAGRIALEPLGERRFRAATDDPQIVYRPAEPLAPGWYEFAVHLEGEGANPKVYFDFGLGFGFAETFALALKRVSGARWTALVKLPFPASLVRFDPTEMPGDLVFDDLSARPAHPARVAAALALHALRLAADDPGAFLARAPEFWKAARAPRFIQMRDRPAGFGGRSDYAAWIARHDYCPSRDREGIEAALAELCDPPLISVVMPVYDTPERLLDEAIASVANQIYPHWELCIADDCSTRPHVRRCLDAWSGREPRIKVVHRARNGHIARATNSAFELASGTWIALLDHDDLLREHALAEVALEIARHPDAEMIYSDEDKLDARGRRYDPHFKPAFSRELFRSQNYLNHLTVHRAGNIRAVGGWRPGFEGSQDYDLNLRILERIDPAMIRHIPKVLYHWRAVEGSTAASGAEKSYAHVAGRRALAEHVQRTGLAARVEAAPDTPFYRIRMDVPDPAPLVSLIVPTRDRVELLRGCLESIAAKTSYRPYEILVVDNGSSEPETVSYLAELEARRTVRVLRYDAPFNYSAINNLAVRHARGGIVGLVNNDIEVISPGWLEEMVSWAIQPDVGCVGAKLYYGNDTIQHGGVILGIGGVAGHSHKYLPRRSSGYFGRLKILQNLSAVTAACLVVRKDVYEAVGGLDEENLKVAFNDVDFCLRVGEMGLANVWTPYAELYHLESVSRGAEDDLDKMARFAAEVGYMKRRWGRRLEADRFYSRHLSLDREDFSIADSARGYR